MVSASAPSRNAVRQVVRHVWAALLLLVFAIGVVGESLAAEPGPDALPVAVVAVKSDDALDQAEALTQALRKVVRDSEGWSLGEATQSLEFLALKMNCKEPIDAACEARIADVIKADRYLWCVIKFADKRKKTVTGTLNFWVRGKGTNTVPLDYSANLTDATHDSLIEVAETAVEEATGGAPKGAVKISTGGVAGQLYIDDKPLGALDAEGGTFQLAAGRHHILVKAPGYADAETTVDIRPAATVEASLTMVEAEDEEPLDLRMVFGFSALGLGAVTGAIGLWQALEVNSIRTDAEWEAFTAKISSNKDACEVARSNDPNAPPDAISQYPTIVDMCDRAGTAEIIQAIMFPIAAVSAGVGAYLLGTSSLAGGDDDDDAEAWTLQPIVAPGVQAVTLTYTF